MSTYNRSQGVKIHLQSVFTEDTSIGLYNATSALAGDAASGQADITVADGSVFDAGDTVVVTDNNNSSIYVIESISTNTLTMTANLRHTYETAESAQVDCSQFRLALNAITGTTLTWKTGILKEVPAIEERFNSVQGGGYVQLSEMAVTLDNTSQFYKELSDISCNIDGLRADIVEFIRDVSGSTTTETNIYRGKINIDEWSITNYLIPIKPPDRNSNIITEVVVDDEKTTIPATFGTINNAKMIRSVYETETKTNEQIWNPFKNYSTQLYPANTITVFPVAEEPSSPQLTLEVRIAESITYQGNGTETPSNLFVEVVKGTGKGQVRKVTQYEHTNGTEQDNCIKITIEKYWATQPIGSYAGTLEDQSYVKFVEFTESFKLDNWKCKSFLDENDNETTSDFDVSVFDDNGSVSISETPSSTNTVKVPVEKASDEFTKLSNIAFEVDDTDYNNQLNILPQFFSSGFKKMTSFRVVPIENVELGDWGVSLDGWVDSGSLFLKHAAGVYISAGAKDLESHVDTPQGLFKDKDYTTYQRYVVLRNGGFGRDRSTHHYFTLRLTMPPAPENFEFDAVYLGLHLSLESDGMVVGTEGEKQFTIRAGGWIGSYISEILENTDISPQNTLGSQHLAAAWCLPDNYYGADTNDQAFYAENATGAFTHWTGYDVTEAISGYTNFKFDGIESLDDYNSIYDLGIFWRRSMIAAYSYFSEIDVFEAAIIFAQSSDLKKNIFTNTKGRIFDDTWGGRKTAANLIENWLDQYEHICRLQNWSEEGDYSINYGQSYSDAALINTASSEGGFSGSRVLQLQSFNPSWQILKYNDGYTDNIKEKYLRSGWCVGYSNENGEECVSFLPATSTATPTDTISLADVVSTMQISNVREANQNNIYAEPFVRYNFNYGNNKFDDIIQVRYVHRSSYSDAGSTDATPGLDSSDGEYFWNRCNTELWPRTRVVNEPPQTLTDQHMIRTYGDAKTFLDYWITWQLCKRISVPVYYAKAYTWHVGRHIYLNLPHQTNGSPVECVIEGITKKLSDGACVLDLVMLDSVGDVSGYYIQDVTYGTAAGAAYEWLDTTTEYGNTNDKQDNT